MKKLITAIITLVLLFSNCSCGSKNATSNSTTNQTPSTTIPSTDINPTTAEPKEDDPYMNKTIELKICNKTPFYSLYFSKFSQKYTIIVSQNK